MKYHIVATDKIDFVKEDGKILAVFPEKTTYINSVVCYQEGKYSAITEGYYKSLPKASKKESKSLFDELSK